MQAVDAPCLWVPKGISFWELSCEDGVTSKANADYKKRTAAISLGQQKAAVFVFVTARRWPGKAKWLEEKRGEGYWLDVRAFDADDLEQWLEESPAVALSFGDELGLIGPSVETLARSWQAWASQSNPTLTPGALFSAREPLLQKLVLELRNAIASARSPITLRGDSVAEAVAFACATILL